MHVIHKKPSNIQVHPEGGSGREVAVISSTDLDDNAIDKLESQIAPGSLITLREQLDIEFTDKKRQEAARKMKRKLEELEADKKLKNDIITFTYATDYSYLRRSSPEEVWEGILRREAWKQIPVAMTLVTLVQVGICAIVMIAKSSPVNVSTLVMAVMYVIAMATSNPFVISKELTAILRKQYAKMTGTRNGRIIFLAVCTLLSPLVLIGLGIAYLTTAILDFTTGPILDVSFGSMVNIIVNIIVVFSALSIGLRSQDPINAIQTFVGFDFVNSMDEGIISFINVDLMAPTTRINNHAHKMLVVRLAVYVSTIIVLGCAFYLTISNNCLLFCNDTIVL
jgi:hypothetical protein